MQIDNFIAVDIGNTTIEFAVFENNQITAKDYIASKPLNVEDIKNLAVNHKFKNAIFVVSSVVKANNEPLKIFLENTYSAKVLIIDSSTFNLSLKTENREISSIGMDIIAKSEWAIHHKKNPCIIADVGTATVVQYVDENGYMNKVAITLGLASIYKSLNIITEALPLIEIKPTTSALGTDTITAMQSGIYWGYIGTIDSLISKSIMETNCDNIFITGGLSKLILKDLTHKPRHDNNIIFEGIKVILHNNMDKINGK
ncbi:MAG: type III pantothenate kinase [Alphaproteobacteria bacterium]|nr:type III pantothenate kinase [Alphaproteobacteria bacterium]